MRDFSSGSETILELRDIHTFYGQSHILQGVSFVVHAGETVALLGRNGAGKTTTVRTIMGFTPPRQGVILLRGQPITGWPPYAVAQAGVGLVAQGKRVFPSLSVLENLRLAATRGEWTIERVFTLFPRLAERQKQVAGSLSGGEQQMLSVARALVTNPSVLVLDEPSEGLSPLLVRELEGMLRLLKGSGITILLVEQNLELALTTSDRALVMNKGRIVFDDSTTVLERSPTVLHQYLGV
ncbi:MAG TPA: ABC transporter ATP-binding protein [Chloroflexota bacterium]|jgi:branched-chain amino acid transport system ATP-binding protein|nr:ABC transporter ATP-binding protein [Chloroflexota bacterium]